MNCEREKLQRKTIQNSIPYIAIIDVSNRCNLHCPYCPTGARRKSGRDKNTVDPSYIERLLSDMGNYLISANLFNWGEPFLHPQICKIVKMFNENHVATHISSNLNPLNKGLMEEISQSGLDYLTVSLSGISQEVYQQYHRGGKIDTVTENLRHLIAHKKKNNKKRPVIEWKYLLFKHNRHEVEKAREISSKLGVDIFRVVRGGGEERATLNESEAPRSFKGTKICHQLWHTVVINADGAIPPCCYLFFKEDDFGEYREQGMSEIRNNEVFLKARKLFNPSMIDQLDTNLVHPCLKCELVHKQPHLVDYLNSNINAKLAHRTGGP
ncbi:radical SAM/SPASM domain-containing protein [Thermodesulfobacteriota bacterium]